MPSLRYFFFSRGLAGGEDDETARGAEVKRTGREKHPEEKVESCRVREVLSGHARSSLHVAHTLIVFRPRLKREKARKRADSFLSACFSSRSCALLWTAFSF